MGYQIIFSYAGHYKDNLPVPVHSHRGTELVYVARGSCVTEFSNGVALEARRGTVYVTPPELVHVQKNLSEDCETFYCVMEFQGVAPDTSLRMIETPGDTMLEQWFRDLWSLNTSYEPELASLLLRVVWLRLEQWEARKFRQDDSHVGITKAMDFLERNYMTLFTIAELAETIGVSQSYLNALFHEKFGHGVGVHLTALRMRHARRLLLNPYYNIAEVGEKCGLPNPNYFVRKFRSFHGVTPGVYRKNPSKYVDTIRTVDPPRSLFKLEER